MAFNQIFTTDFPSDLSDEKDIKNHDDIIASGTLGLVRKNGTVCRMVRDVLPRSDELGLRIVGGHTNTMTHEVKCTGFLQVLHASSYSMKIVF